MTAALDWVWLAGLLEGEGSFKLVTPRGPAQRWGIAVSLEMTDRDVVERAARLMGTNMKAPRLRDGDTLPAYETAAHGAKAETVMRAVLPFMGERRAAKIRKCLDTPNLSHHERITA